MSARNRKQARGSYLPVLVAVSAIIVVIVVVNRLSRHGESATAARAAMSVKCSEAQQGFSRHRSGTWITMAAPVSRILSDAQGTSTHQRFILRCPLHTVLIENNVDVGQRVPVHIGEEVGVHGQYIWNDLGGLVHDTHHATSNTVPSGWIYAAGKVYQ